MYQPGEFHTHPSLEVLQLLVICIKYPSPLIQVFLQFVSRLLLNYSLLLHSGSTPNLQHISKVTDTFNCATLVIWKITSTMLAQQALIRMQHKYPNCMINFWHMRGAHYENKLVFHLKVKPITSSLNQFQ